VSLNIEPFNSVWWILVAITIALIVLIKLLYHDRDEAMRRSLVISLCLFNLLVFIWYKYNLSQDAEFMADYNMETFNIWMELPLQLCNINIWLIPVALMLRNERLTAFCFYTAPLGALMAMVSPVAAFSGDLLLPRNIGYYGMHCIDIVNGVSLLTLGLFKPQLRDVPWVLGILAAGTAVMHMVNMTIRAVGLGPANYLFTFGTDGSGALEALWSLVPVPLLYLYLVLPLVAAWLYGLTALLILPQRRREKSPQISA
jgi:uncharacterized membrane protein YwaF